MSVDVKQRLAAPLLGLVCVWGALLACKSEEAPQTFGGGAPEAEQAPEVVAAEPQAAQPAAAAAQQAPAGAFGSLAYDTATGRFGFSHDFASAAEADQLALSKCGGSCQVVGRFNGGCGAFAHAADSGTTGFAAAASRAAAETAALEKCSALGGTCKVQVWSCSEGNSGTGAAAVQARECGDGQISPCNCPGGGQGVHACENGQWGACTNCPARRTAQCQDGQTRACPCGDGTFGRQTCHGGVWPSGCFLCD